MDKNELLGKGYKSGVKVCNYIRSELHPDRNELQKIIKSFQKLPDTVKCGEGSGTKYYFKWETIIKEVGKMRNNLAMLANNSICVGDKTLLQITRNFINSINEGTNVSFDHYTVVNVAAALQELINRRKRD